MQDYYNIRTHDKTEGNTPNTASAVAMRSGGEGEAVTEPVYPIYHWGGGMRLFPLCMKIPTGSEKQPWRVLVLRRYTTYLTTVS
ncbi:hypothetical protein PC110_g22151 [Phytophthora cactorum]|uniref:Uncharacterized protein n=1 Tax=Phytophthora cactorum TaxID=29920 RepID=A0A329RC55_9STRA|nr:hypothetical protein PC110_g22151 [Phytophthora cactorum]